ncbi:6416_t:CDS:1, partial [Paraglomus brasilianum]
WIAAILVLSTPVEIDQHCPSLPINLVNYDICTAEITKNKVMTMEQCDGTLNIMYNRVVF